LRLYRRKAVVFSTVHHWVEAQMASSDNEDTGSQFAPGLPVLIGPAAPRPSLERPATTAAFVSQLLAERNRLAPQRARRRGSVESALGAYAESARMGVVRLPQGYRKTVVV
jgi:hypothetical protein